jgi:hypothetical protein
MLYAPVPQQWLADALRKRYPKLKSYTERMYKHTFKSPDLRWNERVSEASPPTISDGAKFLGQSVLDMVSPWKQTITVDAASKLTTSSSSTKSPLSNFSSPTLAWSAALLGGVVFAATRLIAASPGRESSFTTHESAYLQPTTLSDFGEAGATLAALGHQMDLEARERERVGGAIITEVDVENERGEVGSQVVVSR